MSSSERPVRGLAVGLCLLMLLPPLPAAAQVNCPPAGSTPPTDNRDGFFVNYEEAPNHPMELSWNGKRLYVTNLPDSRVSVFDITTPGQPVLIREIAVGLGPVTVRRRPEQDGPIDTGPVQPIAAHRARAIAQPVPIVRQLWVVCMSSNALFIIDERTLRLVDSVRLPHRPSGLVFDATGRFAYVTLSDSNRIARINANQPHNAPTYFEFESEMPLGTAGRAHVEEPRALILDGEDLYGLSFLSGNGTSALASSLIDPAIENFWNFQPNNPEPPDRDVLHFDLATASPQGSAALWRMGTMNYDLAKRPGSTDLYVSTVDLINEDTINEGEPQYLQNGFSTHAVSHAAPSATGAPQSSTVVVDLNDPANHGANLHSAFVCATPTALKFNAAGGRLFVACYESRNVALLDAATDRVIADFRNATGPGFGLRGLALSPDERWLYAYGRGDNTLVTFDTQTLPVSAPVAATSVQSVGFDVTPHAVLAGRGHFLDAANSASGTQSCNTCHPDGHLDGIAWDLTDFTGDLESNPKDVPRFLIGNEIAKGGKVTMSLLGIEETPPFHWRGDRADLVDFNPAFVGLLGGQELDETPGGDFDEFQSFVFSLSYPPSPHQALERTYSPEALEGWDCFNKSDVHDVSKDTTGVAGNPNGQIAVSCQECHSMAGASGTLNQINNPILGLLADDATQLRGLWDKTSDRVDYGLTNPCGSPGNIYCPGFLQRIPATGWGTANTGFTDDLKAFVNLGVFDLTNDEEDRVVTFLEEFDTGAAATTAATHQVDGTLPASSPFPFPVQQLLDGADNGHNDLVVRGWIIHQGAPRAIGMLYLPGTQPSPLFVTDTVDNARAGCTADGSVTPGAGAIGPFTLDQLDQLVAGDDAALALIGTPVGSGYRFGLDRDMDCLRDGDEAAHGTNSSTPDFDLDGFPDGYEVRLGSLPNSPGSTPTDNVKPAFVSHAVAWFNSNVVKARWTTDEEATSTIRVFEQDPASPAETLVYAATEDQPKRYHVMVGRGLRPTFSYRVELEAADPSGNLQTVSEPLLTSQNHLMASVHLAGVTLTNLSTNPDGTERYRAEFHVVNEDGADVQGAEVVFGLAEWIPGQNATQTVFPLISGQSGTNGIATLDFDGLKLFGGTNGFAEAIALDVTFDTSAADVRLYFHSLNGQFAYWDQEELYPPP